MDITYLGHSSFRIKGKTATIVTDPYGGDSGLKFPKHVAADIVTISHGHGDHSAEGQIEGDPYIVRGPGEYEIKGVGIIGRSIGINTVYRIEVDGISIVHLGDLTDPLSTTEVEALDGVDILLVPVATAIPVIHEIEPSIVIPMRYEKDELAAFLKEIGKEDTAPQAKLVASAGKLPEQMQVVVLE